MGFAILGRMSDADLVAAANRVIADYGWERVAVRVAGRQDGVVDFELSDQSGLRVTHFALVEALTGSEAVPVAQDPGALLIGDEVRSLAKDLIAAEESEGERLARFFATSAHKGHEAVKYKRPVVPRPDDRVWEFAAVKVTATFHDASSGCALVRFRGPRSFADRWVYAFDTHNPFKSEPVPSAIIAEVRGILESWYHQQKGADYGSAMRAGQ